MQGTHPDKKLISNQNGLVSFIVTAIIMSVLSLITIGFARVMQKNQRESLDRQLSTQAFYAAESGINDVVQSAQAGTITSQITNCSQSADLDAPTASGGVVGYTCVLYNPKVSKITLTAPVDGSHLTMLRGANNPLTDATLSWQATDSSWAAPASDVGFQPKGTWNGNRYISVLRVSIYPIPRGAGNTQTFVRANMNSSARTFFLYPQAGGAAVINIGANTPTDGSVILTNCSGTAYKCNVSITGLNGASFDYYVRIRSVYNESVVSLSGSSAAGTEVLGDAQAIIDATGKANDLKRRVQVVKSLIPEYNWPEAAIETTGDLCKMLKVGNGLVADNTGCADPADPNGIN